MPCRKYSVCALQTIYFPLVRLYLGNIKNTSIVKYHSSTNVEAWKTEDLGGTKNEKKEEKRGNERSKENL